MSDMEFSKLQETVAGQSRAIAEQAATQKSIFDMLGLMKDELNKVSARVNAPQDMKGAFALLISLVSVIMAFGAIVIGGVNKDIGRVENNLIRLDDTLVAEQLRDHDAQIERSEWMGYQRAKTEYLLERDKYLRETASDSMYDFDNQLRRRATTQGFSRADGDKVDERILELSKELSDLKGEIRGQTNGRN